MSLHTNGCIVVVTIMGRSESMSCLVCCDDRLPFNIGVQGGIELQWELHGRSGNHWNVSGECIESVYVLVLTVLVVDTL